MDEGIAEMDWALNSWICQLLMPRLMVSELRIQYWQLGITVITLLIENSLLQLRMTITIILQNFLF